MKRTDRSQNSIRRSILLLATAALVGLTGCRSSDLEIKVQDSGSLIESWLSYKAQVENTVPFAEKQEVQAVSKTAYEADKSREENVQDGETYGDVSNEDGQSEEAKTDDWSIHKWSGSTEESQPAFEAQHGFYYSYLSESGRVIYDEILSSLLSRKPVKISTLSSEQVDQIFQCVLYDHPEIFYVSGYHLTQKTMDGQVIELTMSGQYDYSEEETQQRQAQIDAYETQAFGTMPAYEDEYDKVKYVFDYLIMHTSYRLEAPDNQNICSVFIGGESVCQGYAEAAQYLLGDLGIEASIVTGIVNGGGRHAWNIVKVNGAYYYMDVTWGDVDYRTASQGQEEQLIPVNYDYFLVTTQQLEKSHEIETLVDMPDCTSMQDNYYVREGLYFESLDEEKLADAFARAYEKGQSFVTLKSNNEDTFMQLTRYLLDENHVFDYIDALDRITYSQDDNMYTLCFWL